MAEKYRRHEPIIYYMSPTDDYVISDSLMVPTYELENNTMDIYDPVWGEARIGNEEYDSLLMELARHPLFQRLQAVEQLTLPAQYTTIPNTAGFSRWQHIWGSLVFARKMTEGDERFSERDRIVCQLRTLFSDVGQTAFSHLGDWIFQGNAETEDLHDQELRSLLESFGVDQLLGTYDLTLDETVFPDTDDWVECPSPNLCIDRVDYGLREILRWMSPPAPMHLRLQQLHNPQSLFQINDEHMLEITDSTFAGQFAAAYNLLPTEHWAQPVHRLQLELMQVAVKRALLDTNPAERRIPVRMPHPRDILYGVDSNFNFSFNNWEGATLSETMEAIGLAQRKIYAMARRHDLGGVFYDRQGKDFPDPLSPRSWQSEKCGLVAPQVELEEVRSASRVMELGRCGIRVGLPPLKMRSIDPLVAEDGESYRLSERDDSFAAYCGRQQEVMARHYEALLLVNRETSKRLHETFTLTEEYWQEAVEKPRNIEDLRTIVAGSAFRAIGSRYDTINDWHSAEDGSMSK